MTTEVLRSDVPLVLVDGHNLLFRAAFGTPAEIFSRHEPPRDITTELMFPALLRKGVNDDFPRWPEVIVVFDGESGSAARKEVDPAYKANRPDLNELPGRNPFKALPSVKQGLELFGIAWIEVGDAEADDVIATLVEDSPGRDVVIMSLDQDFYQLLRDREPERGSVRVLNTARRQGDRLLGPRDVIARYGVTPAQFADFRALCGDASDNIAGVRGVGPKTAAGLLAGGLLLEDLEDSGRLVKAKGAAIAAAWPQVLAWRDMIRMRRDVPLSIAPTGAPTAPLPPPAAVIAALGLWGISLPSQVSAAPVPAL